MTYEDRVEYTKRLHALGIITVAQGVSSELMFRAVAAADHVAALSPCPGWAWIDEENRRAKALHALGLRPGTALP